MAGPEAWAPTMKSRQKGKKKGSSKERVFGCDLQDHLLHSGQDGRRFRSGGARREGAGCHPPGHGPRGRKLREEGRALRGAMAGPWVRMEGWTRAWESPRRH